MNDDEGTMIKLPVLGFARGNPNKIYKIFMAFKLFLVTNCGGSCNCIEVDLSFPKIKKSLKKA